MTEYGDAMHNTAESWSTVGIQAGQVNGSTVHVYPTIYQTAADATPLEKYKAGLAYLNDGVPAEACKLIGKAIAGGYEDGQVRFHWLLAMLSKRSLRDLTPAEREQLARVPEFLPRYADDEWRRALEAVCELLERLRGREDTRPALKGLLALQPTQREKIERHLDLVLTGSMKASLWAETHHRAMEQREANQRNGRVWAYFEPDPIEARARPPAQKFTTRRDKFMAVAWSGVSVIAGGYLGWTALLLARPLPILAFVAALAAGYVAVVNGLERHYRAQRLAAKEREYSDRRDRSRAPEGGFGKGVDHSFAHYFAIYVPHSVERETWLAGTAGIRSALRDEIVEIYRESRIPAERINWLIRYLVGDVRKRWETGNLWEYRDRYRTPLSAKVRHAVALVALVPATMTFLVAAIPAHPLTALLAAIVVLTGSRAATARWFRIISEYRRFAEEDQGYERALAQRQEAFERWQAKLDSTRPSETEMEDWLYCDKIVLLGRALRRYQLAWPDIIAHAFLQVPARSYTRARVKKGPWRYSNYDVRLFLVTPGGVREVRSELDFENASFRSEHRTNFSFASVSSVEVSETNEHSYTLALTLTNGPTRKIRITEPEAIEPDSDEDPDELAQIDLDAAGFAHTRHILEGIAAEGLNWIENNLHANGDLEDPPNLSDLQ